MSFGYGFDSPFISGTSYYSSEVPGRYMAALDGRPYMLDLKQFRRKSSPVIRQQADSSNEPGEQSLNPNDLWRRSQSSFDGGAGQDFLDLPDSDRTRFNTSKGLDPWTKGGITLLNDTEIVDAHAGATSILTVVAGARLYLANNQTLKYTTDGVAFTTVTGTAAFEIKTLATDGFNVWIGYGAVAPIDATNTGVGTAAVWNSGAGVTTFTAELLAFVKNRLMGAQGAALYNFKTSAAATTLTPAFLPASWVWTAMTETPGFILAAGYVGDKSSVFRITIQAEGTDLGQPVAAVSVTDGETIHALGYYVGFVLVGTSRGARLAAISDSGAITYGSLIETPAPVYCFEPQGDFTWFGWTNYDGESTGLGRMNLRRFTLGIRPAYATDLMLAGQGRVTSAVTFLDKRFYTVAGQGLVSEAATRVASGTLTTGQMGYGLTDPKVFYALALRHEALRVGEAVQAFLRIDKGTAGATLISDIPVNTGFTSAQASLGARSGIFGEMTFTVLRGTDTSLAPVLNLWTVRAWPIPRRSEEILLPLMLQERVITLSESEASVAVLAEFARLKAIERDGTPIILRLGAEALDVFIDSVELGANGSAAGTRKRDGIQGLCNVLVRSF